jgi:TonB family protein
MKNPSPWGSIALSIFMTLALLALIPYLQNIATQRTELLKGEAIDVTSFTPPPPKETPQPQAASKELTEHKLNQDKPMAPPVAALPPPPTVFMDTPRDSWSLELPKFDSPVKSAWTWADLTQVSSPENPIEVTQANLEPNINKNGGLPSPAKPLPYDKAASALRRPAPPMPTVAKLRHLSGEVEVEFTVNKLGQCVDINIIRAEPELFGPVCIETIRQWQFSPAQKNGEPVESRQYQTIIFSP